MLKLKLRCFGHLVQRADSPEKPLMLGKIEGRRRRGWQRMTCHHWINGHESEQTLGGSEGQGSLACCSPRGHRVGRSGCTAAKKRREALWVSESNICLYIEMRWCVWTCFVCRSAPQSYVLLKWSILIKKRSWNIHIYVCMYIYVCVCVCVCVCV